MNQAALRIRTTHTAQRREWTIRGPQVQGMDLVGLYEGESTRIPIMELTEVRIRQGRHIAAGLGIGALVAAGLIVGLESECASREVTPCDSDEKTKIYPLVIGGSIVLGALIGAAIPRWATVYESRPGK